MVVNVGEHLHWRGCQALVSLSPHLVSHFSVQFYTTESTTLSLNVHVMYFKHVLSQFTFRVYFSYPRIGLCWRVPIGWEGVYHSVYSTSSACKLGWVKKTNQIYFCHNILASSSSLPPPLALLASSTSSHHTVPTHYTHIKIHATWGKGKFTTKLLRDLIKFYTY